MATKKTIPKDFVRADDRALIKSCSLREPGAWDEFLSRFSKLIYFGIHRTLQVKHYRAGSEEIEDLFHEVLVRLIKDEAKKLRQYRGREGCSVATWIRTITVRFTIDYLRQRSRSVMMVEIEDEDVAVEVSMSNPVARPDEEYESRDQDRMLSAAVAALDENDRYFIELYYGKGMEPERVARILKMSVKTVYSRVNRIKQKLKDEIENSGRNR